MGEKRPSLKPLSPPAKTRGFLPCQSYCGWPSLMHGGQKKSVFCGHHPDVSPEAGNGGSPVRRSGCTAGAMECFFWDRRPKERGVGVVVAPVMAPVDGRIKSVFRGHQSKIPAAAQGMGVPPYAALAARRRRSDAFFWIADPKKGGWTSRGHRHWPPGTCA